MQHFTRVSLTLNASSGEIDQYIRMMPVAQTDHVDQRRADWISYHTAGP